MTAPAAFRPKNRAAVEAPGVPGLTALATALLPLLLAGCVAMAPPYAAPALPVAVQYPGDAGAGPTDGRAVAATGWRDYFADPRLQTLITQALDHNRDLRSTALRVEEARAAAGIQRADLFPTVGAQAGIDRSRTPADLSITRQPQLGSQYQAALGLASWEIDFWGRVRSLNDAALENFLATDAARQAVMVGLIAQVANSYLGLCELDERLVLARRSTASREESLRIFTRRVAVGAASRLQLTQMQTLLTQAQALVAQLALARAQQAHALTLLAGSAVDLSPAARPLDAHQIPPLRAGLPSDLLTLRPDIVAAEHQLRAAHAQIGAARAAFFPRIALTGLYGTASSQLAGLFDAGSQKWVLSPLVSLPLLDAGRRENNLSLAEVRRHLAVANYEKAVQGAFRDVSDALAARAGLARQLVIAQDALAAQAERARLSQLRYDHGASAFLDVLDAQRDLLVAEQQVVQVRRALLSAQVSLYAALGGGGLTVPATGAVPPANPARPAP